MSIAAILKLIPLLTPAVDAVKSWLSPRGVDDSSARAPGDATAERQGTAAGAAANYAGKVTERNAHASLEERLNARLQKK